MPVPYRESVVLAPASVLQAGKLDQLNQILFDRGLGRPLRRPEPTAPGAGGHEMAVLPLAGAADPMAVRAAVRREASERGVDLPELSPDILYSAGTVEDNAVTREFAASGKKTGHGLVAWLPAPSYEMADAPPWRPVPRRPVIALLDTGVQPHNWLPAPAGGQPFWVDATEAYGWQPPVAVPAPDPGQDDPDFGSHWGHATFLAGLIRLAGPDVQILSMRVMSSTGKVSEQNVVAALDWLAGHTGGARADVVLMAFGRRADAGDADLASVRQALLRMSDLGVRVVASAGNQGAEQGCERPVYPAAYATDPELSVVSVGARTSATERAPYSNYGVWVREWAAGTNVISIMPLLTKQTAGDGYAWWSGTSFAAAAHAGALAQQVMHEDWPGR